MSQTAITALRPAQGRTFFDKGAIDVRERATFILPYWFWAGIGAVGIWGAFSSNPTLTPVAVLILAIVIQSLWRRGEPPILVFACAMQWLQASVSIFYTDFYGVSVAKGTGSGEFETATWLSLIGVLSLTLGMRLALVRCSRSQNAVLVSEAMRVDIGKAFVAFLATFFIATVADRVAFAVPALTQIIFALVTLKWMVVFVVACAVLEQRAGYLFLNTIIVLEIAYGLFAYFASFKSIFFVLLVVVLTSPLALRGRRLAITLAVMVAIFFFGVVWTAIKVDYREFLNQGTEQQTTVVSTDESADKLSELIGNFTWNSFTEGLDKMILRINYTSLFAATLMNVPDSVPFENGTLWFGALKHVVTPRILFPDKAAISDSDRTTLYTGVMTAGEDRGTSIGIGYMAESYVDFGPFGMFTPIFLLGVFYGLIYRFCVIRSRSKLIWTAIAGAILIFAASKIETSNIKILGGVITDFLVVGVIYLFCGRVFRVWLEQAPHE